MSARDDAVIAGSALGAFGAAGAALTASLCCAGPAVLALVGTTGAFAAASLEPYRLYMLGGSYLMLAGGFWRAYVTAPSCGTCTTQAGRLVRPALWFSLVATIVATVLPFIWS